MLDLFLTYLAGLEAHGRWSPTARPRSGLPPEAEVTAPWTVIRLHGRNVAGWQKGAGVEAADEYLYSEEELREWAERARSLAARVERLFVMFNNCTRGQAAVNAARMVDLFRWPHS